MFEIEAVHLTKLLSRFPAEELSPLLNIGSGTLKFRTEDQPWIEARLLNGLRSRGVHIINVDMREGEGIDLKVDFGNAADAERAKATGARAILCTNVLEHIAERQPFCDALASVLPAGGLMIVTVPNSYPHHRDPIDTMFRPTAEEIAAHFPGFRPMHLEIQPTESYWFKLRERPWLIFRHIFRAPFPMFGFARWKRSMGKLYWLFTPYKQAIFIGVKT